MKRFALFTIAAFLAGLCATPELTAGAAAQPSAKSASGKTSSSSRRYRYGQRSPSRERCKQIQLALKHQGYDPGPIDGRWGSKTSRALRRFERDHDLRADGKLDSLALITLGLGPRRPTSVSRETNPSTKSN